MKNKEVHVKFDPGIPGDVQAKLMFDMEVSLQRLGYGSARVFKATMGDDSKLRVLMTPEQRDKL